MNLLEAGLRENRATTDPDAVPNPATVVMLGPMVRGSEVTVR
ncbi:hypothetical protein [Rhodococcus sp. MTM3W5.2]|nr:hypothetical protein [Rhodococcus sp. MTM3W5.2]